MGEWKVGLDLSGGGEPTGEESFYFSQVGFSELPPNIKGSVEGFMLERAFSIMGIATNTERGYLVVPLPVVLGKVDLDENGRVHFFMSMQQKDSKTAAVDYRFYEVFVKTGFNDIVNHMTAAN